MDKDTREEFRHENITVSKQEIPGVESWDNK